MNQRDVEAIAKTLTALLQVDALPDRIEFGIASERMRVAINANDKDESEARIKNIIELREIAVRESAKAMSERPSDLQPKPRGGGRKNEQEEG